MGFYENSVEGSNCIQETIRKIIDAQDKVTSRDGDCCTTSCKCSVHDLLSPEQEDMRTRYTTIPFMLTCKKSCQTFIGKGVYSDRNGDNSRYFGCVATPILKAKKFVKGSENCVELELLLPATEGGSVVIPDADDQNDVCAYFPNEAINNFQATGICITVDLHSFTGITCLDPVTPFSSNNFPNNNFPSNQRA